MFTKRKRKIATEINETCNKRAASAQCFIILQFPIANPHVTYTSRRDRNSNSSTGKTLVKRTTTSLSSSIQSSI